jgi:hypothetical protein
MAMVTDRKWALLGMLAVGLAASGWAEGTNAATVKPEGKSKFDTPCWSPEARWKREVWSTAAGVVGNLDGPRMGILSRRGTVNYPYVQEGGPFNFIAYDDVNEQVIYVGGGARGCLDGPLSRARFGGSGYSMGGGVSGMSPDGRFYVMGDGANKATRLIDLKEQTVRTVPDLAAMKFFDKKGQAWLYSGTAKDGFKLMAVEVGALKTNQIVAIKEAIARTTECLFDEVNNRVYQCGDLIKRDGTNWFVSYLDLGDGGAFHGVLGGQVIGPNPGYAGSFDGYKGYPNNHVQFGPDDPEHRYLYYHGTDTGDFRRLDLQKRTIVQFDYDVKANEGKFIETMPTRQQTAHVGPTWLPNGDFIMPGGREAPCMIYRRVK